MTPLPCTFAPVPAPRLGLVVLQADETIERDFRGMLPPGAEWLTSRVPSGADLSPGSIARMGRKLTEAAARFPQRAEFDVLGYACTSASAQIGSDRVAEKLRAGAAARAITDPVLALCAGCAALGVARIGLVSPYVPAVSDRLREALSGMGIATPVFGSFGIAEEAQVVRIDASSLLSAATTLCHGQDIDAVFLSCTNLRTLDVLDDIEATLGLPALSSNQVLAWHMLRLSGGVGDIPGRLGQVR